MLVHRLAMVALATGFLVAPLAGQQRSDDRLPTIEDKTRGMTKMEGYIDLYWEEKTGKLFLELDQWDTEFLYQVSLASGLGSNPVGLDRGQLGTTAVLKAMRVGPTVLLVEPNYRYRARSENAAEVRAVADAFAPSTQWGFAVVAETGDRALVDATDFFLRDTHGAARAMQRARQGSFRLERSRSVFYLPNTKAFPRNTEVETWLTFTSDEPGPLVRSTAASGEAVTLRQHHSFIRLPEPGYVPRAADPRVSSFGITFHDYATPIDQSLEVRWIARHRLQKRNPNAVRSEPVRPIVYYLDPGTPEPIRSALIEGAAWWNDAFEEAGFINAFRVEVLPQGADSMDVRYNMIHWTHRSTRGWSYGSTVIDPRTGEIIKGNVNLGSLRLRQDHMIAVGLNPMLSARMGEIGVCTLAAGPTFDYLAEVADQSDPVELALARVRQLSAHEVGHTLGFAHNYIASTYGRASVMDYPAPLVHIRDGRLDLRDAYDVGIGEWDKFAVRWAYAQFPPGTDEATALDAIVREGLGAGLRFITDRDARPLGAAHPLAALWDNGEDPVAALRHEIEVRRLGLQNFGPSAVRTGEPMAFLEEVLVPLYLHHRYQLEAAAHTLGGADYTYALRGDDQTPIRIVPGDAQRAALDAMLATVTPEFLALPERILRLIPPRAFGFQGGETFERRTGLTFDPLGVAASAGELTMSFVFHPERMARLVEFKSRDESLPGLDEVTDRVMQATWGTPSPGNAYHAEIQRTVQRVVLDGLMRQAASERNIPQVRAILTARIAALKERLAARRELTPHDRLAVEDIDRWQRRMEMAEGAIAPELPPGSPIGSPPPR